MANKITIRDLAKQAGVSVTTVSQILNGKGQRFSEQTREKVLTLKKQLNYVPDFNARNLIMRSSKTIGVLLPNIANPFFAAFVKGIQKATRQAGFMPLIFSADHEEDQERYYLQRLVERSVDGLWEYEILLAQIDYVRVRGTQTATARKVLDQVFHQE